MVYLYDTNWLDYRLGEEELQIRTGSGEWRPAERWEVAEFAGYHELADVIREQPGREAVREGMSDVLHWLRECKCYTPGYFTPCEWRLARMRASFASISERLRRVGEALDLTGQAMREYYTGAAE